MDAAMSVHDRAPQQPGVNGSHPNQSPSNHISMNCVSTGWNHMGTNHIVKGNATAYRERTKMQEEGLMLVY